MRMPSSLKGGAHGRLLVVAEPLDRIGKPLEAPLPEGPTSGRLFMPENLGKLVVSPVAPRDAQVVREVS